MSSLKTRAISVQGMTCADCEKKLRDSIGQLEGVHEVNADSRTGAVTVSYDLLKTDLSAIEQELGKSGFPLKHGVWGRLKRGWTHYTEQNERDNLTAGSPPCCSSPDSPHPKTHG
jgi:copper chaperone CopZ